MNQKMTGIVQSVFVFIFLLTALLTLASLIPDRTNIQIEPFYKKLLFSALILELIGVVLIAGKTAFTPPAIEQYYWGISYPLDLEERFKKFYFEGNDAFKAFYHTNRYIDLHRIDKKLNGNSDFLNKLFVLKKAGDFADRTAKGELYVKRSVDGLNRGKAVLTFPDETQPIAFDVNTNPQTSATWHLKFMQPARFVEYQGRMNRWDGGDLNVGFKKSGNDLWEGNLMFGEGDGIVDVGKFVLSKQ